MMKIEKEVNNENEEELVSNQAKVFGGGGGKYIPTTLMPRLQVMPLTSFDLSQMFLP